MLFSSLVINKCANCLFSGRRFIKQGAVPSIFPFKKETVKRPYNPNRTVCIPMAVDEQNDTCVDGEINLEAERMEDSEEVKKLKESSLLFQRERDYLKQLYSSLLKKHKMKPAAFSVSKLKNDDEAICFYTGFPTFIVFQETLEFLDVGENGANMVNCNYKTKGNKITKPRKLKIEDEFFLVMIRLRLGLFEDDLAYRFEISDTVVNRICITWINYMYLKLGRINIWPSQEVIRATMPDSVKAKYPNLEWIIDAFEIQSERPSSLCLQSESYSNYKSRNTVKGLLACTPAGHIGFVSQLYTGRCHDRELTIRSGFLQQKHNRGAMWMADKGFLLDDLCAPLGVQLNIPAFVGEKSQLSREEVIHTQEVANQRIHIERAINKVKKFHIFDRPIPLTMWGSVNQMWTVCAILTLFQNPIISA